MCKLCQFYISGAKSGVGCGWRYSKAVVNLVTRKPCDTDGEGGQCDVPGSDKGGDREVSCFLATSILILWISSLLIIKNRSLYH